LQLARTSVSVEGPQVW